MLSIPPCLAGFFLFILILWGSSAENLDTDNMADKAALGVKGMVSAAHPLATQAGLEILEEGGNAFDAAVAIAATLNVVEPMNSGIGGYGTILVYDVNKKRVRFLDSSGKIPLAVDSDMFRPPTPNYEQNRRGSKAVSTPGNVNAWEAMSQEYGKLPWKRLFKSAIALSEKGFSLDARTSRSIEHAFSSFPEHAKAYYGRNGEPLKSGELLIQKDLAGSMREIAEQGAQAVYGGEIGLAIDEEMRRAQGFLTIKDLEAATAEWWEPIRITYRKHVVYTASPPSTAFPSLIRLGMMSQFDLQKWGHNSPEYLHRFAEVTKHAFWCRLAYAGDPEINPPPLEKLLSERYWKEAAAKVDLEQAAPFAYPKGQVEPSSHTTHFVVADKWGNIVSATQTLGNSFGSRIMPEGTGVWLNNSLAYCTFEPKGNPMDAHAGHRKLSGDCPTIIFRNGRPWVALGTPGGHTIGQTVPQMVINLVDFKMNIQQAVSAPRISFEEPDMISIERGVPDDIRLELMSMGHKVSDVYALGNAHALAIEYGSDGRPARFLGAADPRGEGLARGM